MTQTLPTQEGTPSTSSDNGDDDFQDEETTQEESPINQATEKYWTRKKIILATTATLSAGALFCYYGNDSKLCRKYLFFTGLFSAPFLLFSKFFLISCCAEGSR
jgi:hypothetical protein